MTLDRRGLLPLVFFCLGSLNLFFSLLSTGRVLGLSLLVLLSPFLDWSVCVVSGSALALVSLTVLRSESRSVQYLGALVLTGAVLQVLPTLLASYSLLMILNWFGEVMVFSGVILLTVICMRNSKELFLIPFETAVGVFSSFLFSLAIPLQVWSIATMLPIPRPLRAYPQFNLYVGFETSLRLVFPITVSLALLLVTEWLWLPVMAKAIGDREWLRSLDCGKASVSNEGKTSFSQWRLLAGFSVLVAVLISCYQWSHGYPLGHDSKYYLDVLSGMDKTGMHIAFFFDRPILFLCLYGVQKILGLDSLLLLRVLQPALAIMLVATTYHFVRFVAKKENVAALAAFLAAVSPHVTLGADELLAANWLGISLMLLFSYAFLRSVADRSVFWAFVATTLFALTLGIHSVAWLLMMAVILCYLLLGLVERCFVNRGEMIFHVSVVLGCVSAVCLMLPFAGWVEGHLHRLRTFLSQASPTNFIAFLSNQSLIQRYFGIKHFAIPLLYALALLGYVKLMRKRRNQYGLIRSWFIVSCLGFLLVRYSNLWRFFYLMPLEILGAFGLADALDYVDPHERSSGTAIDNGEMLRTGLLLATYFFFGLVLTFSHLPSSVILLSLGGVALMEMREPFGGGMRRAKTLLVTSLILVQIARCLYVLT